MSDRYLKETKRSATHSFSKKEILVPAVNKQEKEEEIAKVNRR